MAVRKNNKRVFVIPAVLGCLIIAAAFVWLNLEPIKLYLESNNPLSANWAAIQLNDGEILYGHLAGVTDATIGLRDVYSLQKFTPAETVSVAATSTGLALSQTPDIVPPAKLIPIQMSGDLFIDRHSVLYFSFISPDNPVVPYLQ